jgi:GTP cyclohydrolase I
MDRDAAARAIEAFLRALDRDPGREPELEGTGARVAVAWADELLAGYAVDVDTLVAQSVIAAKGDLVIVRDVPVSTICPHHLTASTGSATVAFAPSERLLGLGTVARLVDAYARRLALQERIGQDVVAAIDRHLQPRWAACRIVLEHGCMTLRGARAHGSRVETVATAGPERDLAIIHGVLGVGR